MTPRSYPLAVILLSYNRCDALALTIGDIERQQFGDFVLIIADDASTDRSEAVIEAAALRDRRVVPLLARVNVGMPQNLVRALNQCDSKYVAILHDGDRYPSNLFSEWMRAMDACTQAGFAFNPYRILDREMNMIREFVEPLDRKSVV